MTSSSSAPSPQRGLHWRSSSAFILATVTVGLFTDLFLYGLVVPVLPFLLSSRLHIPEPEIQAHVSGLLAAYAGASVVFSVPAGVISDRVRTRRTPFLAGLGALLASTVLLAVGQSVAVLVLARVLQGTSAAVVWTVGLALVRDTVGTENLGKTMGSIFSVISTGQIASPVLGGALFDMTGYGGVFELGACLLVVDFAMRLLVIEKKVAARYCPPQARVTPVDDESLIKPDQDNASNSAISNPGVETSETALLLPTSEPPRFTIPSGKSRLLRKVPIIYCLSHPGLISALLLCLTNAFLYGAFDATIPTTAASLFGFTSLNSGLLFLPLFGPSLILGPVGGWAVDHFGTKLTSVVGFGYFVPVLALLRLPHAGGHDQIILYSGLLALCGVGLAMIGSPPIVEASRLIEAYHKTNPELFGEQGPYAQLYGFTSLVYCVGLTLGPLVAGSLRDWVGYGNMNAFTAAVSGVATCLAFAFVGGTPRVFRRKPNYE